MAIASLVLPDLRIIREWEEWPGEIGKSDIDHRGERYARSEAPGTVTVRRVADDSEIAQLTELGRNPWCRFSPDGRCLAVCWHGGFKVWNLDGPQPTQLLDLPGVSWWGFSPDGRHLAAFKDGKLELMDLKSALLVRSLGTMGATSWPAFSPNGQYVAVPVGEMIRVVDVDSGKSLRELALESDDFEFAWNADSKTLAVGVYPGGNFLWDVVAGKKTKTFAHQSGGMRVAVNATGDLLLSLSWWNSDLRLWNLHTGQMYLSGSWGMWWLTGSASSARWSPAAHRRPATSASHSGK